MPDERFYSLVFRHILYLQDKTGEVPGGLTPTVAARAFYQSKVGTLDPEYSALVQEARAWRADVDPVDTKAHNLIESIHAKTPGGRLAPGETPPSPPAELTVYQQERDSLTLAHIQKLRSKFGNLRFAQIDKNIHQAANVTNMSPRLLPPKS